MDSRVVNVECGVLLYEGVELKPGSRRVKRVQARAKSPVGCHYRHAQKQFDALGALRRRCRAPMHASEPLFYHGTYHVEAVLYLTGQLDDCKNMSPES